MKTAQRKKTNIKEKVKEKLKAPDFLIILITFGLAVFGLIMVFDSSLYAAAALKNGNEFSIIIQQAKWFVIGTILFFIASYFPYKKYRKITLPFYILTVLLLIYVLFTADPSKQNGARRWASLAEFQLQPSEIAKLTFTLYMSAWLSVQKVQQTTKDFLYKNSIPFLFVLLTVVILVVVGNDLSTAIIIGTIGLSMYLFSIKNRKYLMAFLGLLISLSIALFILMSIKSMITNKGAGDFRAVRFQTFFDINLGKNLSNDELHNEGYQIDQTLIGVGSGGLFGKGFTKSQVKYSLPETVSATDAIFAVFAEEFGFVGCVVLVGVYLTLVLRGLSLIDKVNDPYAQLIIVGIMTWLGVQAFVNIMANVALIPVSGVPLPLISYGGSSLSMLMTSLGIVTNISRYRGVSFITNKDESIVKSSLNKKRSSDMKLRNF